MRRKCLELFHRERTRENYELRNMKWIIVKTNKRKGVWSLFVEKGKEGRRS